MPSPILACGSLAFDIIFSIPHDFRQSIPVQDGKIRNFNASFVANKKQEFPGGTAGNIAFWLGQEAVPVTVFSAWGKDFAEKGYRPKLENLGTTFRGTEGEFTAHAYMVSDPLHQQLIIWQPNSYSTDEEQNLSDFFSAAELQRFQYAIFSAGSPKGIHKHLTTFRKHNPDATIIFDPGQVTPIFTGEQFQECCKDSNILVGNNIEFEHFRKYGIPSNMTTIETFGVDGVKTCRDGKIQEFAAHKVQNVIEPTGAGDAFRAGFLAGLAQKKSFEEAVQNGIRLGAKCVTLPSAQF